MKYAHKQSGFTAVELLITLFVAAAFLVAGYQLFSLVIRDGGQTRSESRAANVAYDYMRQYTASSTTVPCTASTPLTNAAITVDGLINASISITVTCLPSTSASLSRVEATISFNVPQQTVTYATYSNSSGTSGTNDVTNGIVGWLKLNGDANDSSSNGNNGTVSGAIPTIGATSTANTAYAFAGGGAAQVITANSPSSSIGQNMSVSAWVKPTSYPSSGAFRTIVEGINPLSYYVSLYSDGSLQAYRYGTNPGGYHSAGAGTIPLNQWTHVVVAWDTSSVSLYTNGALRTTVATTGTGLVGAQTIIGAESTGRQFIGSIDDVRVYNRTLPATDVSKLYTAGAK